MSSLDCDCGYVLHGLHMTRCNTVRPLIFRSSYGTHLLQNFGIYPIVPDDTCYFLAIDFDDGAWAENVAVVRNVCEEWEISCGVERSRSGEGAHLWIFFEDAVPCALARKLGSALL